MWRWTKRTVAALAALAVTAAGAGAAYQWIATRRDLAANPPPGPLVVVGASLGGFTVRVFASERPERVVGLVLVDASHEDQEMEFPRIAPLVPFLSTVGVLRVLGMSLGPPAGSLAPSVQAAARAT